MSFKEMIQNDMNVFFNADEFGEEHAINGITHNLIVDSEALKERIKDEFDGVSVGEILYFVKESEFGPLPAINSVQIFDNRQLFVIDAKTDMGMHEIILSQNRGA